MRCGILTGNIHQDAALVNSAAERHLAPELGAILSVRSKNLDDLLRNANVILVDAFEHFFVLVPVENWLLSGVRHLASQRCPLTGFQVPVARTFGEICGIDENTDAQHASFNVCTPMYLRLMRSW